jgi:hypothetical protein
MSNAHDWRQSLSWIDARRDVVTARAYAGFVLTWVSHSARCAGDRAAFAALLRAAFRHGRPSPIEVLVHVATWGLRRDAGARFRRGTPAVSSGVMR